MRQIAICDNTVRRSFELTEGQLSFRIKVELAKLLDQMGVEVIETCRLTEDKSDYFLIKCISSTLRNAAICVPVDPLDPESPAKTMDAIKDAVHPRLQLSLPVSTVQMEYFCHKKPQAIIDTITNCITACRELCNDVEFVAEDFGRAEAGFLTQAINAAVAAGATTITLSDCAGDFLPDEFRAAILPLKALIPQGVRLGISCSNELRQADSCALEAVRAGADEVKVSVFGNMGVSIKHFPVILHAKSAVVGADSTIKFTELQHKVSLINQMCASCQTNNPSDRGIACTFEKEADIHIGADDDISAVLKAASLMGYDLDEEDSNKVYESVIKTAKKGGAIEGPELEAIIASVAYQVPPTYKLDSYVINSGNIMMATSHIRIHKGEEVLDAVGVGDGPVDASFIAIEKLVGCNYELDDFRIRSVTEGREALGETVVRLRHEGLIFSGRGVSTDIVGSSIMAYLNAINKIAYAEEQA